MRVIGVAAAASAGQMPRRSRMSWLPRDSAMVRVSSDAEPAAPASTSASLRPLPLSPRAAAAPTGPPPAMRMSKLSSTGLHQRFDIGDGFGRRLGEHVVAVRGHEHVVFDANADAREFRRHAVARSYIAPRLDGQHHPGLERAPIACALVI